MVMRKTKPFNKKIQNQHLIYLYNECLKTHFCCLKLISWILSIIFLVAVIFLYLEYLSLRNAKYLKFKSFANEGIEDDAVALLVRKRMIAIQKNCKSLKKNTPLQYHKLRKIEKPWIFVSRPYKFLYCQTPKVGSTNWMEVINNLEGNLRGNSTKNIHYVKLPLLSNIRNPSFKAVFDKYFKFMVIREPFKRALSAYKDKFLPYKKTNRSKFYRLSQFVTYYYRSPDSTNKNHYPSFDEFIAYITDNSSLARKYKLHYSEPRHWKPQTELCRPCNVDYDYILDIDNVAAESKSLFKRLNVPANATYPKSKRGRPNGTFPIGSYDNETMEYFLSVSPKHIHSLYVYYEKDFKVFNYKTPSLISLRNLTFVI